MLHTKIAPDLEARELLYLLKINSIPINPYHICSNLNIEIVEKDMDSQGIFLLKKCSKKIIINKNIKYETRKRFTVSHEIGHYIIPGHEEVYACSEIDIQNYRSDKIKEREANIFAAELLMPEKHFKKDVDELSLSIDSIKSLSEKYLTSLAATAIKVIKLTKDSGAIIMSKNNKTVWVSKSEYFKYTINEGYIDENSYVS